MNPKRPTAPILSLVITGAVGVLLFVGVSGQVSVFERSAVAPGWWIFSPVGFAFLASLSLSLRDLRRDYLSWGSLLLMAIASTFATLRRVEPDLPVVGLVLYWSLAGWMTSMLAGLRSSLKT